MNKSIPSTTNLLKCRPHARRSRNLLAMAVGMLCAGPLAAVPASVLPDGLEAMLAAEWSSRYVSKGRDESPGDHFIFTTVDAGWRNFAIQACYAQALSGSYNEVDLSLYYHWDVEWVKISPGIMGLYYPSGVGPDSYEGLLNIGIPIGGLPAEVFVNSMYDFVDVKGGFINVGLRGDVPMADKRLHLRPHFIWGIDAGYVSKPRRLRSNNLEVGLEIAYTLSRD